VTCALVNDGSVGCWGANASGQLADGTTTARSTPLPISGLSGVESLAVGTASACVRLHNGTARCWGANASGQTGNGTVSPFVTSPVSVNGLRTILPDGVAGRALESQVARLYIAFLQRPPDAGGLAYFANLRRTGRPVAAIADAFAASTEFTSTYGQLSDDEFVLLAYGNVLGREPDLGGFLYWSDRLATRSISRGGTMAAFADSAEFVATTATTAPQTVGQGQVTRIYLAALGRSPDPGGLRYWSDLVDQRRASIHAAAYAFSRSAEFAAQYGTLTDDAFVGAVYRSVFGRDPDPAGQAYWTSRVGTIGRSGVMVGFSDSAEYVAATHTFPLGG